MDEDEPPREAGEAARYAVLRRVAPALRHDLIVNLQAVVMMTEVMGARLDKGLLAHAELQDHVARIQRASREAVANALKVAAWLDPPEDDRVSLVEGLRECVELVRGGFEFQGIVVRAQWTAGDMDVSRNLLRSLVPAAMIRLADQGDGPGELMAQARLEADRALLELRFAPAATPSGDPEGNDTGYRPIGAQDLQALAATAGVALRDEGSHIQMWLPRLVPTTPLQIAPL